MVSAQGSGKVASRGPSGAGGSGFPQVPLRGSSRAEVVTVAPSLPPARRTRGMGETGEKWDATRVPMRHSGPTAQGPGRVTQESKPR